MYFPFFGNWLHACLIQVACLIEVATKTGFTVSQIYQYFLPKKMREAFASHIFSTKNISLFGNKVVKHLTVDLLTSSLS